ncbi:MAG: hypothetical protein HY040_20735 [Planctomycetes bacterium]|nr:hypothetical protein [Planctomycetota bacterium]
MTIHDYKSDAVFEKFAESSNKFDFLYIAAHGAHHCFGENAGPIARWADFATILCRTSLLNENAVLFMGCCHGGLKKVSLILFSLCDQISSVCGPRWTVDLSEVPVAIHVFLHNLLINQIEPQYAAERTAAALGIYFPYYNRYELETEILYLRINAVNIEPDYTSELDQLKEASSSCCTEDDGMECTVTTTTTTAPPAKLQSKSP